MQCSTWMGTSSLNVEPGTQVFSSYWKWNDLDPRLIFQMHGEKEDLLLHTTSHYASDTAQVNAMIYREEGLITSSRKHNGNKEEFLPLLETTCIPPQASWFQCWGHQLNDSLDTRGNQLTDLAVQKLDQRTVDLLTFWWHIVTHYCLRLHSITEI